MSEWISVKDKMPENNTIVLAYARSCLKTKPHEISLMKCIVLRGNWLDPKGYFIESHLEVAHWMPLPEPPTE